MATERNKNMTAFNLEDIATFNWNETRAQLLRDSREKLGLSRKELSQRTRELEKPVTEQYIQQLETPHLFAGKSKKAKTLTVSKEIVESLCEALGVEIGELFWVVKISSPSP